MAQIAAQCQKNLDSAVAIKESGRTSTLEKCAFRKYCAREIWQQVKLQVQLYYLFIIYTVTYMYSNNYGVYCNEYLKINPSKQTILFAYSTHFELSLTFSAEVSWQIRDS